MTVGLVMPVPAAQAAAPAMDSPVLDEAHQALEQAKETGQRVEVQGERGERTSVFANPDGFTFTLEQHSVPIRVAKPGGGWQTPDATLEKRADGTVGPKAASADMTFSGGADNTPLVKIADQGRSMELDWKGDLPAPELDGANAVYRNVLPDVDLKVTATVESFQQVLVVKTPKAAANPALKELTFDLKTDGLAIRKGAAGNLSAVDGNGNTVFRSPPARMWDSAGKPATEPTTDAGAATQLVRTALAADDVQPTPGDPSEQAASGTGLAPGQGDNVSRMDVNVTHDSLSVIPDADMLTNTASDDYPLFIDPTVTWGESERTLLRSDGYESYGWGNGSDGQGQGAGKCGSWNGYYCGPGYVQKLYFEFAPDSLRGKKVLDATFALTEPWAFQCDPRWVDLVRTDNISSATTWASRPKELDWMVDRYVSAGRGSLCDPNSPDAPIEFNDNPDETNENLTPTVQSFAAGQFSRLTLEVRAHDETDASAWKRFKNDAVLRVSYVSYPATPTAVGIVSGSSSVCSTDVNKPSVVDDPTPALTSTPQTASGGEAGAKLHAWFRIEALGADGKTWSGSGISSPTGTNFVGDNIKQTVSWPTAFPVEEDGIKRRFASLTQAFYDNGTYSQSSGYSNWCYFTVDRTRPKMPNIQFAPPYKPCLDANNCPAAGAPGLEAGFTFGPADGDTNNAYYAYDLTEVAEAPKSPAWTPLKPGQTKATFTPTAAATYKLTVHAVDTLNRVGADNAVEFKVATGEAPVGRWNFTEGSGVALDSAPTGGASDATLAGDAVRTDRGRRGLITHDQNGPLTPQVVDQGLSLSGAGYAATDGPVVQTSSSYTVSAWVRLEDGAAYHTVLGQDSSTAGASWYSAFYLSYRPDSKTWELRTSPQEGTSGDINNQIVRAKRPAVIGAWTHLAAVYDSAAGQIKLYVNGEFQGSHAVAPSWSSSGRFQIGRVSYDGAYVDQWKGQIDEVAAWQRALFDSEIADEARATLPGGFQAAELVAGWSGAGASGTTVTDSASGYGRSLALSGATASGEELVFDGVDDTATTGAAGLPQVDDSASFTVSTKVKLDQDKINAKAVGYVGQVLGQWTANGAGWGLWYEITGTKTVTVEDPETQEPVDVVRPVGYWFFGVRDASRTHLVRSDREAELGTNVRLTGVYDAQDGTVSLRLGTTLNGVPTQYTDKLGTSQFAIGAQPDGTTSKYNLPARISDVRVWVGAMNNATQIETVIGS
ncbi:LamG domain-containing protein [Streptomyces sp. NPDC004327]|uniref:LamG domain-containing protein n=1 Tax=Streptomyces sp. NPDC004327 TaxID=3364699 RepID=UPI0036CC7D8D